ncbi:MAG: DNA repair exonuclease [Clostridia bacterium]|nr:DNA repair exonuclease [Clostridia bacterium]
MKFIHLADVHFDMVFSSIKDNRELVKKRRLNQKQVFKNAIELAKEETVNAIFVAGDLFENKYVEEDTIKYIISCFNEIPEIKIFITPGNHDPLIKNSPYNTYSWPDNVHIFGSEIGMYEVDGINIYGIGFEDYEMDSNEIEKLEVDNSKTNILIAHANLNGATHKYHDIKTKALQKFDYVALGHIHMPKVDDSNIIYPGSLTAGGFDELDEHGLVIGEIENKKVEVQFKKMDFQQFAIKEIDITNFQTVQEIVDCLKLDEDIYRLILTGVRHMSISSIEEAIKELPNYITEIIDNTHLEYNLDEIAKQNTLKGIFTKNMLNILEENPEKERIILNAIEYIYKNM